MKRIALLLLGLLLLPLLLSGCILNSILDDVVNANPRAVIDAKPTEGPAPLTVSFDAHYSHDDDGTIAEYRWDLGDPAATGSQVGEACSHTFTYPGTYLAKLTVIDDEGAVDSQQVAIVVTNAPPVAQAAVDNDNPYPGAEVTFDGTESYDLTGTIVSYSWDFGDNTSGDGEVVTHTFLNGGEYTVTLTVTDNEGATCQVCIAMNVQPGQSNCGGGDGSSCGGNPIKPLAVITGLPSCSGGKAGVPLTFDGTASRPAVGDIVRYYWDFGDGTTATGAVVQHTYTYANRFVVTLSVTDEGGGVGVAQGACPIGSNSCY
jgi:PKD repeat protein